MQNSSSSGSDDSYESQDIGSSSSNSMSRDEGDEEVQQEMKNNHLAVGIGNDIIHEDENEESQSSRSHASKVRQDSDHLESK